MLREFCAGEAVIQAEGLTVMDVLSHAILRYPMLEHHLMTGQGRIRDHLHLFLNEDDVRDDLWQAIRDGDQIYVLLAMSGGLKPTFLGYDDHHDQGDQDGDHREGKLGSGRGQGSFQRSHR
jgi:hypothetical protein